MGDVIHSDKWDKPKSRPTCFCDRPGVAYCKYPLVNEPARYEICGQVLCSHHGYRHKQMDYCKEHAELMGLDTRTNEVKAASSTPAIPAGQTYQSAGGRVAASVEEVESIWIKAKFPSHCFICQIEVDEGEAVLWFPTDHRVACYDCGQTMF